MSVIQIKHVRLLKDTPEQSSSSTTLSHLPLEMLDIILQKSYLSWILNSPRQQRDKEYIRSLILVDVCFYRRITRRRFRKAIWRYLKDFYGKNKKGYSIIRNNRNYLIKNIEPNDALIVSLVSLNCITEQQSQFIQRKRSDREKNAELLNVARVFDKTKFLNCVKCLRKTNQYTVAKIIENGGAVLKLQLRTRRGMSSTSMDSQLLHQTIQDLLSRSRPWPHQTDKFISRLRQEGLEILNCQLDRQTVIVWIWCRSQAALETIQWLHESNQLRDIFSEIIVSSISQLINIDFNQFNITIVACSIFTNFTEKLESRGNWQVLGVTKLRNEICVLCVSSSLPPHVIRVFDERNAFLLWDEIKIQDMKFPSDIRSSETENCVYVCDNQLRNIWLMTKGKDGEYRIIKWLTTDYMPWTLSVSSDDQLLVLNEGYISELMIYGSETELIRSIQLPREIKDPRHVVKTSNGNIIICHRWIEKDEEERETERKIEDVKDEEEEEELGIYKGKQKEEEVEKDEEEETESVKVEEGQQEWEEQDWMEETVEEQDLMQATGGECEPIGGRRIMNWAISELSGDGQMVVRSFIPSDQTQKLNEPCYLSLDSDDRVFVADGGNGRVILLDSDLNWNCILVGKKEEHEGTKINNPQRLFYDVENKRLMVAGDLEKRDGVIVFTLIQD